MSQPVPVVAALPGDGKSNPPSPAEITVKDAIPVDSTELVLVNLAVEAVTSWAKGEIHRIKNSA